MKLSAIWKTKRRLWQVAAALLLALSLTLTHFYQDRLLNLVTGQPEITQITPPPCDLNRQACALPVMTPVASEAPWTFSISPRPIPVSAPLDFTLTPPARTLAPHAPLAAWIDLTGDSMDMGLIRIPLQQEADGRWVGIGSIPVCVTGAMRWRARLNIQLAQTTLQADWIFSAPEPDARH